ncbi:thioredoxin domain-containing protein [Nonomuraea montanisoli]|uniref:hypothetical protein n=1 Tax=Nonomuraea montanisoli TaxID=2741721 RepID=UPI001963E9E7|nr:hypothetical protein [Nonomuraea montanisoli]
MRTTVAAGESRPVRADSHRLRSAPDGKVTLVEFLDFECEACRACFPVVEHLRKGYAARSRSWPATSRSPATSTPSARDVGRSYGRVART